MEKTLKNSKSLKKFDYYSFFKWISIGFGIASVGIAIAIALIIITGKRFF
jgi:hypothetical protein